MVVARIGVAAVAVRRAGRDRVVVVAAHDADVMRPQQRQHAGGIRPEAAKVTETEDGLGVAASRVGQHGGQRLGVRVHAAEHRDAAVLAHAFRHVAPVR